TAALKALGNLFGYNCILVFNTSAGLVARDAAIPATIPHEKFTILALSGDWRHSERQKPKYYKGMGFLTISLSFGLPIGTVSSDPDI
ncbi:jg2379, partial [Pararge aegeria aegeria]